MKMVRKTLNDAALYIVDHLSENDAATIIGSHEAIGKFEDAIKSCFDVPVGIFPGDGRNMLPGFPRVMFRPMDEDHCHGIASKVVILLDAVTDDFINAVVRPIVAKWEKTYNCKGRIIMVR